MSRRIAPGSLEDRLLEVIPPAPATMEQLIEAGRARPEDVKKCLQELRAAGVVRMLGHKRSAVYVRAR